MSDAGMKKQIKNLFSKKMLSISAIWQSLCQCLNVLTLNMLNCFKDFKRCIHTSYHIYNFVPQNLTGFIMEQPWMLPILYCEYHACRCPGGWFNIKMTSYQYRKSNCGDKTVVRSSYLLNGISYTGKMTSLYWIRALATLGARALAGMAFIPKTKIFRLQHQQSINQIYTLGRALDLKHSSKAI